MMALLFYFVNYGKYKDTYKFGKIVVEDNCFIGLRSIVTKSVPSGEVWGGVPARFIMKTEDYAKKCYDNRLPYDPEKLVTNKKEEMLRALGELEYKIGDKK